MIMDFQKREFSKYCRWHKFLTRLIYVDQHRKEPSVEDLPIPPKAKAGVRKSSKLPGLVNI